jgi:hypothetical protein
MRRHGNICARHPDSPESLLLLRSYWFRIPYILPSNILSNHQTIFLLPDKLYHMENIGESHPSAGDISSHGSQPPEYQVHYTALSAPQTGKVPERIKWECCSRQVLPNVPQLLWVPGFRGPYIGQERSP